MARMVRISRSRYAGSSFPSARARKKLFRSWTVEISVPALQRVDGLYSVRSVGPADPELGRHSDQFSPGIAQRVSSAGRRQTRWGAPGSTSRRNAGGVLV
ncbi:hypothetical protein B1H19_25315 [Streptomyces gilvosporeus]|uniref:Uncharacterized protein n=1 Tax=Streptomyces gilvosporeus TaxID=553510 RepID=A0A1V0TW85_9ACTN|nr:hypothetical protein B1H19_25315 [Streptomyces gilvosporeus]